MKWWVYQNGEVSSQPYNVNDLKELEGFDSKTQVRHVESEKWVKAGGVEELSHLFTSSDTENRVILQWYHSFLEIFTSPSTFFNQSRLNESLIVSVGYAIVIGYTGMLFGAIWQFQYTRIPDVEILGYENELYLLTLGMILFGWVGILLSLLIVAAMYHVFLTLFDWAEHSYASTLRIVCYSSTSGLANIIPFIGGLIGGIWGFYLNYTGLKRIHSLTTGQAILTVFAPFIISLFLTIIVILFVLFGVLVSIVI